MLPVSHANGKTLMPKRHGSGLGPDALRGFRRRFGYFQGPANTGPKSKQPYTLTHGGVFKEKREKEEIEDEWRKRKRERERERERERQTEMGREGMSCVHPCGDYEPPNSSG